MKGLFIISGLGILGMLAEIFKFKKFLYPMILLGLLAAYAANFMEWNNNSGIVQFTNMIRFDNVALAFSGVIIAVAFLWFVMANDYFESEKTLVDHSVLILFALVGALMLTAFSNMTTLFLGVEILSIPLYVLAASRKKDTASNEAGFKYLIMGSFASGFLLFGIALVYGATGTFDLLQMRAQISSLGAANLPSFFYAGVIMMLIAMAFKVSVAPFHFWAPDVYDGSPTVITAFMSTVVKTAAFAAFMRLFLVGFSGVNSTWSSILVVMIALSLVVANLSAAAQSSVKRMLAYSSISHAAFMLMGILAVNSQMSVQAILYYTLAYSVGSIASFTVLYNVSREGDISFNAFNGLARRNPLLAFAMLVSILSLAGIPLTAGFFAKYYVFTALISTNYKWLLILAVLTSAIGVYYYFKVVIAMYFKNADNEECFPVEFSNKVILILCVLLTLLLGLFPGYVVEMFSNT